MTEIRQNESVLFESYRAIGIITSDIPMVYSPRGKTNFITVAIGKSFQVYRCDKLTPAIVSSPLPKKISVIEAFDKYTFTAYDNNIIIWKNARQIGRLDMIHTGKVIQLLSIGNILVSLGKDNKLIIWNIIEMKLIHIIQFQPEFTPSFIMHPSTYLNKIIIGSEEGKIQLWNIRTLKCIYEFNMNYNIAIENNNNNTINELNKEINNNNNNNDKITCMVQSPALDVIAIGFSNGLIIILNIKINKILMKYKQDSSVTSISFCTDPNMKIPIMTSSGLNKNGNINIWNLQDNKKENILYNAHNSTIISLLFLPNEPILISSGTDNCIKIWIFDQINTNIPRLLKSREGHKTSPTYIRYYGANNTLSYGNQFSMDGIACQILSASKDHSLRIFHTEREQQSREFSQGKLLNKSNKLKINIDTLKLNPIKQFAAIETREKDFPNIITCHENDMKVYTWEFKQKEKSKHILYPNNNNSNNSIKSFKATAVSISTCGHFGFVGTSNGIIYKYNMQSGEERGSYPFQSIKNPKKIKSLILKNYENTMSNINNNNTEIDLLKDSHNGTITGIVIDSLNKYLISTGTDGTIRFWDIKHYTLQHIIYNNINKYDINIEINAITNLEIHRDSNLIVTASDDQIIRIYDIETKKLIRRFQGHTHRITDLCFTYDGRWLLSSSNDNTIRVWDIPTGKCIDWLKFKKPVISLTISTTGEYLATAHIGLNGIYLWSNKSFFSNTILLNKEPEKPIEVDLPAPQVETDEIDNNNNNNNHNSNHEMIENNDISNINDLSDNDILPNCKNNIITLSKAPRSVWQTLFNLELIKERNKPKEQVVKPIQAPFFLPTTAAVGDTQPNFIKSNDIFNNNGYDNTLNAVKNKDFIDESNENSNDNTNDNSNNDNNNNNNNSDNENENDKIINKKKRKRKNNNKNNNQSSRILETTGIISSKSILAVLLDEYNNNKSNNNNDTITCINNNNNTIYYTNIINHLIHLSASGIDIEISTLCLGNFDTNGIKSLILFIDFIQDGILNKTDFQLFQALLNRFLNIYGDIFIENNILLEKINKLYTLQKIEWENLQDKINNSLCLIQYFSKIQI